MVADVLSELGGYRVTPAGLGAESHGASQPPFIVSFDPAETLAN
jgi:hypothetical protein